MERTPAFPLLKFKRSALHLALLKNGARSFNALIMTMRAKFRNSNILNNGVMMKAYHCLKYSVYIYLIGTLVVWLTKYKLYKASTYIESMH